VHRLLFLDCWSELQLPYSGGLLIKGIRRVGFDVNKKIKEYRFAQVIAREADAGRYLMEASMFLDHHKANGVEKDVSLSDIGADIARKLLRTAGSATLSLI